MSWTAQPQLETVPAPEPKTIADAVKAMHDASMHMARTLARLEAMAALERETPEMRTVQINPGNNGVYTALDKAAWTAKSIGILNPGSVAVYLGIGGASPNAQALAPSCPGSSSLILPVEVEDLQLGCDATSLGTSTALVFIFRFVTVQPLVLRQVP